MEPNILNMLTSAPDLKDKVKKPPEGVLALEKAGALIRSELEKYKAKSILFWRRQTGIRIFGRGETSPRKRRT
ncbi:MAG: hypothetical protein QW739_02085 [Candidatus Odinarchaeota archaeon]